MIALTSVSLLVFVEGLCSFVLLIWELPYLRPAVSHENFHVQYDPDLGWVNAPNVSVPDLYRPGVGIHINSQSLRADREYTKEVPAGMTRAICLGDSFTMGFGVRDDQTWCHLLTRISRDLETLNMGQGGYGLDQAYLRYRRDGEKFDHNIAILAFISDDIRRLASNPAKPNLEIENGRLIIKNTPVPRSASSQSAWMRILYYFQGLRFMELVYRIRNRSIKQTFSKSEGETQARNFEIAVAVFEDFARLAKNRNALPVFVYLPTLEDHVRKEGYSFSAVFAPTFKSKGLFFLDLTPVFRDLTPFEAQELFLRKEDFPNTATPRNAARHYSMKGNQFVATYMYKFFLELTSGNKPRLSQVTSPQGRVS
ncbi:MAG: hypothetical protein A2Z83_07505 [Omnitrophica bacterium GWA2_52_8]|nr:MAG: hypothetical protein A2Z83_07505 [Omnitrophica bacterium GWA2_52_8]